VIAPDAVGFRAQAITIEQSGAGAWVLYDAHGKRAETCADLAGAIVAAAERFHVRMAEWRTTRVSCCDSDECRKCGGHGFRYITVA